MNRKLGFRQILMNTASPAGGAPDTRFDAINDRLGKLSTAVETLATHTVSQQRASQKSAEIAAAQKIVDDAAKAKATVQAKLTEAYEAGNAAQIAAYTADVGSAAAEEAAARMHLTSVKARAQQEPPKQTAAPQQSQKQIDDSNLKRWSEANKDWYGIDSEMTAAAKDIDKQITSEGILATGSEGYFRAVDARLRVRFPDKFKTATPPGGFTPDRSGGVTQKDGKDMDDRIPQSVAAGYRRMGLDVDNPDVAKTLIAARKTAVDKGFLPEEQPRDLVVRR